MRYSFGALIPLALLSLAAQSARAFSTGFAPMGLVTAKRALSPFSTCLPYRRSSVAVAPLELGTRISRTTIHLRMADDGFSSGKVTSNKEAADGLRLITVDVGTTVAAGYKTPGQYLKMRSGPAMEKPGFFAIASPPGTAGSAFDFLIKRTDGSSWFCDTAVGDSVELSNAQGPGYRYAEKFDDSIEEIIILATGSGIAPLKAAVESKALKGKSVRLYYGCRTPATMAFQSEFPKWEKECGVKVVPCISQGDAPSGMKSGYVQNVMMQDGIASPAKTGVLFCGVNDMVKQAKEVLVGAGVKPENMLMNF